MSAPSFGESLLDLASLQAPSLGYSVLLGGDNSESYGEVRGLVVDSSGNAYVLGNTTAIDFFGAQQSNAGGFDVFVSKLDPSGELLWSTLLGGSSNDTANGIALDSSGDIYITGQTTSLNFPGAGQNGANELPAFVSKLSSGGELLWSTLVLDSAVGQGIAVDSFGDIYITGLHYSQPFVSKLSSSGELLWSISVGGSADQIFGIAVDSMHNAYVTGYASRFTDPDSAQPKNDAFVSKLSSDGKLVWSTVLGGSAYDSGQAIAVDSSGHVYVTGSTPSDDFPGTNQSNAGASDVFVSKLNSSGERVWSIRIGGGSGDAGRGIALDASGDIYITGATASPAFPGANQSNRGGDAFVSKLNSDGDLLWSILLGGSGKNAGYGIAVDPFGNLYVAGNTESNGFLGPNGTTLSPGNVLNAVFAVKLVGQKV